MSKGRKQLLDQIAKAQDEMAKWPNEWRDQMRLDLAALNARNRRLYP
jgi:hypothetical protein